jgi:D-lactate dehydrogenase
MKVAVFSTKPYDETFLSSANANVHDLVFLEPRLTSVTASLATAAKAVCAFVNDDLSSPVLEQLAAQSVELVVLRSAGFNHVDLSAAASLGITVARVPAYSPHAVAEHAIGLILALNRKLHRAYNRVRENNFALAGLLGFDLHGCTVGVVGTGQIGAVFARIMVGFGCEVLAFDPYPNPECEHFGVRYVELEELLTASQIVSLHCPLTATTHHLINGRALALMPEGAMLINTGRGALVDTVAAIEALKNGHLGHLGLDVYEEEAGLFFEDRSGTVIDDDVFSRLLTFPNVLITAHQGFFTEEALTKIASTTISNLNDYESGTLPPDRRCSAEHARMA